VQCTIYNSNASIRLEIHNIVKKVKQIQSLEVYELPNFELLFISAAIHILVVRRLLKLKSLLSQFSNNFSLTA